MFPDFRGAPYSPRQTRLTRVVLRGGQKGRRGQPLEAGLGRASGSETFSRFVPLTPSSNAPSLPPALPCKPRPALSFAVMAACNPNGTTEVMAWLLVFPVAPHAGPDPIVNTRQCIHGNDIHGGAGELLCIGARASCFSLSRSEFSFRLAA